MNKKILLLTVIAGVLLIIYWVVSNQSPKSPDYSKAFPIQGWEHIAVGNPHLAYNSNPPTSGWHYNNPADEKFYNEELPDEQLVHNLEHGDIWIAYRPGISEDIKNQLRKFGNGKTITTARSKNEFDIALVAWGRLDAFNIENNILDENRIASFIKRYTNKGPEKILPQR